MGAMFKVKKLSGNDLWEAGIVLSVSAQTYRTPLETPSTSSLDLTIFVSLYNEEACILATLDTVVAAMKEVRRSYEILVIDDCSADNSSGLVRSYIEAHPELNIVLIVNKVNRGLAQNFYDGARIGHGEWYRLVCGDDVEPLETLVTIFRHVGEAEMVIPYQVECPGKTFFRVFLSRAFTIVVNRLSGHHLKYYNGLAIHRRYNVKRWPISHRGFGFQADLITRLLDEGVSFVQVPVKTHERQFGKSTALTFKNLCSVAHTLFDVLIRRFKKKFRNPFRDFSLARGRDPKPRKAHTQ